MLTPDQAISYEKGLMYTVYQRPSLTPKIKVLADYEFTDDSSRNLYFKLITNKPVLEEDLKYIGTTVFAEQAIDSTLEELLEYDYIQRVKRWLLNIEMAHATGSLELVEDLISQRPYRFSGVRFESTAELVDGLIDAALNAQSPDSNVVKNPFVELADVIGDYGPGTLHIVAGAPGGLKTGLIDQLELMMGDHYRIGVLSLELLKQTKLARYAQHLYGEQVGPKAIESGLADITLLKMAAEKIRPKKIYIDDRPTNIIELIAAMEVLEYEVNPHIYTIDFLQHLQRVPRLHLDDYDAIKDAVKQIARFAKDKKKPVILLSQINRNARRVEYHNGRPIEKQFTMADLEGAGTIEQMAFTVMFLDNGRDDQHRHVYMAKNRNGQKDYDFGQVEINPEYMNFNWKIRDFYKNLHSSFEIGI